MGLIKFGGGVAAISGAIGGTVYARNKSGAYARNWAKPTNAPTVSQTERRVTFGNVSAGWNSLTAAERNSWNAAAALVKRLNRFGEEYVPSGRQYYMELNQSLATAEQTGITAPPLDDTPPTMADVVVSADATTGVLTAWDATATMVGTTPMLIIEATPPMINGARTNFKNLFRQIAVTNGGTGVTTPTMYTSVFGSAVNVGDLIAFRLTALETTNGLRSASLIQKAIVT